MFFDDWQGLARTALAAIAGYAALVLILRVSGKRTLAKMNAFDLVVTVALGSSLATVILSKDIVILEGVLAFAMLAGMQWMIAWASVRSGWIRELVKSEPRLVFHDGQFRHDVLRRERLTEGEVRAAVRESGLASMDDVGAVVLETAGDISVIPRGRAEARTALADLDAPAPA